MSLITEGLGSGLILKGAGKVAWLYSGTGFLTFSGSASYSYSAGAVAVPIAAPRHVGGMIPLGLKYPRPHKLPYKKIRQIFKLYIVGDYEGTGILFGDFVGSAETSFEPAIVEIVSEQIGIVIDFGKERRRRLEELALIDEDLWLFEKEKAA